MLPSWLGLQTAVVQVSMAELAQSVFIYLGISLIAGILTHVVLVRARGKEWRHNLVAIGCEDQPTSVSKAA